MTIGHELRRVALRAAYDYLDKDPETNMTKLMEWVDKFVKDDVLTVQRDTFRNIIANPDCSWYKLLCSLWDDVDDEIRRNLFENIIINASTWVDSQREVLSKGGKSKVPWALTMHTKDHGDMGRIDFDKVDGLIEEAKEKKTFMFIFSGESVLTSKEEIIALCNKHESCQFMCFTRGMDIDEDFAAQIVRVKNLIPAIQVSGTQDEAQQISVMQLLHDKKVPFGMYGYYDEKNMEDFVREDFYRMIVNNGGKFCFLFSNVTDEKDIVYPVMKEFREKKPILAINFCKDEAIIGGAMDNIEKKEIG